jgi:hypothetical protein
VARFTGGQGVHTEEEAGGEAKSEAHCASARWAEGEGVQEEKGDKAPLRRTRSEEGVNTVAGLIEAARRNTTKASDSIRTLSLGGIGVVCASRCCRDGDDRTTRVKHRQIGGRSASVRGRWQPDR